MNIKCIAILILVELMCLCYPSIFIDGIMFQLVIDSVTYIRVVDQKIHIYTNEIGTIIRCSEAAIRSITDETQTGVFSSYQSFEANSTFHHLPEEFRVVRSGIRSYQIVSSQGILNLTRVGHIPFVTKCTSPHSYNTETVFYFNSTNSFANYQNYIIAGARDKEIIIPFSENGGAIVITSIDLVTNKYTTSYYLGLDTVGDSIIPLAYTKRYGFWYASVGILHSYIMSTIYGIVARLSADWKIVGISISEDTNTLFGLVLTNNSEFRMFARSLWDMYGSDIWEIQFDPAWTVSSLSYSPASHLIYVQVTVPTITAINIAVINPQNGLIIDWVADLVQPLYVPGIGMTCLVTEEDGRLAVAAANLH